MTKISKLLSALFLLIALSAAAETRRQHVSGTIDLAKTGYLDDGDCQPGVPWCVVHPNKEFKGEFRVDLFLEYETEATGWVESKQYQGTHRDYCAKTMHFRFGKARVTMTDLATGKPLPPETGYEKALTLAVMRLGDDWTSQEACEREKVYFGPYDDTEFVRVGGLSGEIMFQAPGRKVFRLAYSPDVFGALTEKEPYIFTPKETVPIGELHWIYYDASNPTPEKTKTTTIGATSYLVFKD
ncbi:MAG: hypothetical protein V1495_03125 [Pseudomonadota bacterium]